MSENEVMPNIDGMPLDQRVNKIADELQAHVQAQLPGPCEVFLLIGATTEIVGNRCRMAGTAVSRGMTPAEVVDRLERELVVARQRLEELRLRTDLSPILRQVLLGMIGAEPK